jgi:hypothetical protein
MQKYGLFLDWQAFFCFFLLVLHQVSDLKRRTFGNPMDCFVVPPRNDTKRRQATPTNRKRRKPPNGRGMGGFPSLDSKLN